MNAAIAIGEQIRVLRAVTISPTVSGTGYRDCRTHTPPYRDMGYYTQDVWRGGQLIAREGTGDQRCDCASACFLIWAAGMGREGNVVGVHAIKFPPELFAKLPVEQARTVYNSQVASVTAYHRKMEIPDRVIGLMWANSSKPLLLSRSDLAVFPPLETVLGEMMLARCGEHPGGANPPEILNPYLKCVNGVREESNRQGRIEYLRVYGP